MQQAPKFSTFSYLFLGHNIRYPGQIRLTLFFGRKFAIAVTILVLTLPVERGVLEPRLGENFANLRGRPQTPLVGKRLLYFRAVLELEINMATNIVGYRMEFRLMPDIGKPLVLGFFLGFFLSLRTTK